MKIVIFELVKPQDLQWHCEVLLEGHTGRKQSAHPAPVRENHVHRSIRSKLSRRTERGDYL
nr:C1 [uncultured bacterium]ART37241.1 D460 [uncultured bacterium]ART40612.1 L65 [uncultured bacterium]